MKCYATTQILGYLTGTDPVGNGSGTRLRIVVNRNTKVDNEWREEKDYYYVIAWAKSEYLMRTVEQLTPGDPVLANCTTRINRYKDKEGADRMKTDYLLTNIYKLDRAESVSSMGAPTNFGATAENSGRFDDESDIPF